MMDRQVKKRNREKIYDRYFTVPINEEIYKEFEKLKFVTNLDKTEIVRRLLDYFLLLPQEAQEKVLRSFDKPHILKTIKFKQRKYKRIRERPQYNLPTQIKGAPAIVRIVKRSGLP